jgi:hypothetical protein
VGEIIKPEKIPPKGALIDSPNASLSGLVGPALEMPAYNTGSD